MKSVKEYVVKKIDRKYCKIEKKKISEPVLDILFEKIYDEIWFGVYDPIFGVCLFAIENDLEKKNEIRF